MVKIEMTSYERFMNVFAGKPVDRVPVAPIVREWAAKQVGFSFSELMHSASKHAYAQYFCATTFGTDALWDLWGIHAEAEAMGSSLKIPENERCYVDTPAIKNYEIDFPKMKLLNPYKDGHLPLVLEGIQQLKDLGRNRFPVIGYLNAPFRLASVLRGPDAFLRDCIEENNYLDDFLSFCTDALTVYGTAVIQAGADVIWISDPTSSGDKVPKDVWLRCGLPYSKRLVKALKNNRVKIFMHMCGNTTDRLETFPDLGLDALSLSEKVDFSYARKVLGDDIILWGNVDFKYDPTTKSSAEIENQAKASIDAGIGGKGRIVLSSGCMTHPDVPVENMVALVRAARNYRL